jgi:hypothetical protein
MDRRKQQVPPLRFAPLGMTKERAALTLAAVTGDGESCRVSLGFAPNDKKRRNECSGIPLKPKSGLNGAPIWSISQQLWWASPGFPVEFGGVGASHAAFLTESRTRGRVRCSVQEIRVARLFGPGTLWRTGAPVAFPLVLLRAVRRLRRHRRRAFCSIGRRRRQSLHIASRSPCR